MVDAWTTWNEELQMWEVGNMFQQAYCNSCEGETSVEEEEITGD